MSLDADIQDIRSGNFNGYRGTTNLSIEHDFGISYEELKTTLGHRNLLQRLFTKRTPIVNKEYTFAYEISEYWGKPTPQGIESMRKETARLAFIAQKENDDKGLDSEAILLKCRINPSKKERGSRQYFPGGVEVIGYETVGHHDF
ncbi:hypothetical protein HYX09_05575 [Candidatus Woesearchaeota archaeon]|nr:hypothetical protein [Candidatus Woesearchaeota archaeon]